MTKVDVIDESGFYYPNYAVINNLNETTKLRVVFDGSCKPEDDLSIHEPTMQIKLHKQIIIALFRANKYICSYRTLRKDVPASVGAFR